ncbi:MAG: HAMP domain-containing histidine kinase [Lachnospiraceae bacterium]|nr:HAMP domain-containing histidine kinase [Lachnospiraceae bacterium]
MKSFYGFVILITSGFLLVALFLFFLIGKHYDDELGMRNVVMNRITKEAEDAAAAGEEILLPDRESYVREYGEKAVPDRTECIRVGETDAAGSGMLQTEYGSEYVSPVRGADGTAVAFLIFSYRSDDIVFTKVMAGAVLAVSYLAVLLALFLVYRRMVKPMEALAEYPEKIAKGRLAEELPRSGTGPYERYVWGMNMLRDEMERKRKTLDMMEREKQTLVISVAHGIKTPLSNIRLYAEAIERGIYHEDKKPDRADAETAGRIKQNVDKAELLVKEVMERSAESLGVQETRISSFYLKEVMDTMKKEYGARMELLHIPFETKLENDPLLSSDADAICRVIAQLLDNAVKYGSGRFISLKMGRQDEDVIISVKNSGCFLSEEETAYVFKSYWRGSNASGREGQGIGLYVAKKTVEVLGGDIFMKCWPAEDATEVTLILPTES